MFAWWGRTVYRYRYIVIGVLVALCLGGGVYGASLGEHVTQSGYYNEESQSVQASVLGDKAYGRDRNSLVVAILTPPGNGKVDDPAWQKKVSAQLDSFVADHKDKVLQWVGWLKATNVDPNTPVGAKVQAMKTADLKHTFVTIPIAGDDDDTILKNYQAVAPALQKVNDGNIRLAGMEPLASELTGTIGTDQKRAEFAIVPLVAVVLFFVFGALGAAIAIGIGDPGKSAYDVLRELQTVAAASIAFAGAAVAYFAATKKTHSDEKARFSDRSAIADAVQSRAQARLLSIAEIADILQACTEAVLEFHLNDSLKKKLSGLLDRTEKEVESFWTALDKVPESRIQSLVKLVGMIEEVLAHGRRMEVYWAAGATGAVEEREDHLEKLDTACFSILDLIRAEEFGKTMKVRDAARYDNWMWRYDNPNHQ